MNMVVMGGFMNTYNKEFQLAKCPLGLEVGGGTECTLEQGLGSEGWGVGGGWHLRESCSTSPPPPLPLNVQVKTAWSVLVDVVASSSRSSWTLHLNLRQSNESYYCSATCMGIFYFQEWSAPLEDCIAWYMSLLVRSFAALTFLLLFVTEPRVMRAWVQGHYYTCYIMI